ncbi:Glutamyl-tRNA(Gln) amidotransferase subunit A [Paraburkholderia sediminicola]|uniref:Glutamyl-tRNA(Gln) amidotransferase subunit A n=1 Tax=Paraburkholderia sediminicola TaxID=458836 RepID=A0A6J5CEI2_9BURK|nr:amidase family protein [Paraburkholderia sediminicola]CAB3733198.1 Glutamyl-tRNA(Gln) amidotransferase subunit A [Paraburkholderia sediminicola]
MLHEQSFESLRALYRRGEISPVDVIKSSLEHADAVNGKLNAFALIDAERAIAAARASEKRWRESAPLSDIDGMPIALKDGALREGWPSRKGSVVTSAEPATENAEVTARLVAAGAILIGKTRMPEFAWKGVTDSPGYGITRNPLNPELTPGGSSGGCSAAVAAGVVRVSIGSDAAGSIRIPAAFTGTFGLKPTFGRVPITPPASSYFSVAHYGPIAAGVDDLAAVMDVISGPSPRDWTSIGLAPVDFRSRVSPTELRVGLLNPLQWEGSVDVIKHAMDQTYGLLWSSGFNMRTVDFDVHHASRTGAFLYRLGCFTAVNSVPAEQREHLDPGLLQFVEPVRNATFADVQRAALQRDTLSGRFCALFDEIDVLMLPTTPILPFEAGRNVPSDAADDDWLSWNPYTPAFNLTQAPAMTVPFWPEGSALPVGIQLVAAKCREDVLLRLASWLEQHLPKRQVA